jgi:hypothetical protein
MREYRDSAACRLLEGHMRDILVRTMLIGAAVASIAITAETTATAQQFAPPGTPGTAGTPGAPQSPTVATQPAAEERGFQITPFMAMGDDLAAGGGVAFLFPLTRRFSLEAEASAGADAMRTGVSLLMDVVRIGRFSTYVAGGAGVQHDETDAYAFGVPFPIQLKKTEFAIGIGGGTTIPMGSRWSYRADFRWYNPKAEWPESWRIYNGLTLHLAPR